MKSHLSIFASAVLLGTAHLATAAILLTDDFTVSTNVNSQPNFEIEKSARRTAGSVTLHNLERQCGASKPEPCVHPAWKHEHECRAAGGASNGNYLLLSNRSGVQNDLAIDDTLADGKPLRFDFDLYAVSVNADQTVWSSFSLRAAATNSVNGGTGAWPVATTGEFGMLRRANGQLQIFVNNGTGITLPAPLPTAVFRSFSAIWPGRAPHSRAWVGRLEG